MSSAKRPRPFNDDEPTDSDMSITQIVEREAPAEHAASPVAESAVALTRSAESRIDVGPDARRPPERDATEHHFSPTLAALVHRLKRRRADDLAAAESIDAVVAGIERAVELARLLADASEPASPGRSGRAIDAFIQIDAGGEGASTAKDGAGAAGRSRSAPAEVRPEKKDGA